MTEEFLVGLLAFGKMLFICGFGFLYMWGGRKHKWVRRFVGGGYLALGLIGFAIIGRNFHWLMIAGIVTYPVALSVGYGGDTLWQKLGRRAIYTAGLCAAGLPYAFFGAFPWVFGLQCMIALAFNIILGIINPLEAAEEETMIAVGSTMLVPFYV